MSTILLIEDDRWLADILIRWLKPDGHAIVHAADAQSALDALDAGIPDALVLDIMLPQANGIQVLHQLQSFKETAHIPVVICSNALPSPLPDMRAYGVVAALDKTQLKPHAFRAAVMQALNHAAV